MRVHLLAVFWEVSAHRGVILRQKTQFFCVHLDDFFLWSFLDNINHQWQWGSFLIQEIWILGRFENFFGKLLATLTVCNSISASSRSSHFFFSVCCSCIPVCVFWRVNLKGDLLQQSSVCLCVWNKICDLTLSHCLCVYSVCVRAYMCIWCSRSLRGRPGNIVSDCCWKDFCGSPSSVGWQKALLYDSALMSGWSERTLSALSSLTLRVCLQETESERRVMADCLFERTKIRATASIISETVSWTSFRSPHQSLIEILTSLLSVWHKIGRRRRSWWPQYSPTAATNGTHFAFYSHSKIWYQHKRAET